MSPRHRQTQATADVQGLRKCAAHVVLGGGYRGIETLKVVCPASAGRVNNNNDSENSGRSPTGHLVPWAAAVTLWGGCESCPCFWMKEMGEVACQGPRALRWWSQGSSPRPATAPHARPARATHPPGTRHTPARHAPHAWHTPACIWKTRVRLGVCRLARKLWGHPEKESAQCHRVAGMGTGWASRSARSAVPDSTQGDGDPGKAVMKQFWVTTT